MRTSNRLRKTPVLDKLREHFSKISQEEFEQKWNAIEDFEGPTINEYLEHYRIVSEGFSFTPPEGVTNSYFEETNYALAA